MAEPNAPENRPQPSQQELQQKLALEVFAANQRLLDAISNGDWTAYADLCDASLTCFEPEAKGHLVQGLPFHKYYFDLQGTPKAPRQTTMINPHLRMAGFVAVLSYVRLTQFVNAGGEACTTSVTETRVWERRETAWKHVHFHRS